MSFTVPNLDTGMTNRNNFFLELRFLFDNSSAMKMLEYGLPLERVYCCHRCSTIIRTAWFDYPPLSCTCTWHDGNGRSERCDGFMRDKHGTKWYGGGCRSNRDVFMSLAVCPKCGRRYGLEASRCCGKLRLEVGLSARLSSRLVLRDMYKRILSAVTV